ncbi:uncharacterized protein EI97DRAFT_280549 [Westerdykella ornata]|uniref:Uncharacterized protein n=1 Tax=Westerdykella ornata TaxID=318751 RepID=A0A6A6JMX2_WESOR|nr:uncharacterized protein EI97DRAFT_280549 [Westerdykella ornata]KAF2278000.1 hypothetical protein EI97DRAFT_280549 [Westerdykella ornata]
MPGASSSSRLSRLAYLMVPGTHQHHLQQAKNGLLLCDISILPLLYVGHLLLSKLIFSSCKSITSPMTQPFFVERSSFWRRLGTHHFPMASCPSRPCCPFPRCASPPIMGSVAEWRSPERLTELVDHIIVIDLSNRDIRLGGSAMLTSFY